MSLPIDPSFLLVPFATAVIAASMLVQYLRQRLRSHEVVIASADPRLTRHCLYCRRGKAHLRSERTAYDAGELVETRCYACSHCGLPQWVVTRTSVTQKAG